MSNPTGADPYLDRVAAAAHITAHYFPVSARALRDWRAPVTITIGNRAAAKRSEWATEALRRLQEAQFVGDGRPGRVAHTVPGRRALNARRARAAAEEAA